MGFFQSAKNQVGRDFGKVISNAIFGRLKEPHILCFCCKYTKNFIKIENYEMILINPYLMHSH